MKNEILHLEQFKNDLITIERSPVTINGYMGDVTLFVRWYEESFAEFTAIDQITYKAVCQYKQHLLDQQARASTINRRLASLAAYTHWAMDRGLMKTGRNPVQDVKSVRSGNPSLKWLDPQQRERLLHSIEKIVAESKQRFPRLYHAHQRDATIVILLLNSGLRIHELIALKLTDICLNLEGSYVIVREDERAKKRSIPLNDETCQALQRYLATRPEVDDEALFIGIQDQGVAEKTVKRAINRFAKPAGLIHVTPLTCRHTFARTLVEQGVALEDVAALLGSARIAAAQIYAANLQQESK